MERGWQVIAPIDGAEQYARIQKHAAGRQDRGGGRKNSRKRQSEDGFVKGSAGTGGDISEFRSCLFFEVLMKAQADNRKMKEIIGDMNIGVQTGGGKLPAPRPERSRINIR